MKLTRQERARKGAVNGEPATSDADNMKEGDLTRVAIEASANNCPAAALELFRRARAQGHADDRIDFGIVHSLIELSRFRECEAYLKTLQTAPDWRVVFAMGQISLAQGRFLEAEQEFRQWASLKPGRTAPWIFLASALTKQEKASEAIHELNRGLAAQGDIDEVQLNLGLVARSAGDYAFARDALRKALQITPDYRRAQAVLDDVHFCLSFMAGPGDPWKPLEMSDAELRRLASEADDDDMVASAAELLRELIARGIGSDGTRFRLAECLRILRRFKECEALFAGIESVPADKRWFFVLAWGQLHFDQGDFIRAEARFRESAQLNPGSTLPWIYLGSALARQERFPEAIQELRHAVGAKSSLDKGPLDEVYLNLGLLSRSAGGYAAAREFLQKALALNSNHEAKAALADVGLCLKYAEELGGIPPGVGSQLS